jgi:hypothetical protein
MSGVCPLENGVAHLINKEEANSTEHYYILQRSFASDQIVRLIWRTYSLLIGLTSSRIANYLAIIHLSSDKNTSLDDCRPESMKGILDEEMS